MACITSPTFAILVINSPITSFQTFRVLKLFDFTLSFYSLFRNFFLLQIELEVQNKNYCSIYFRKSEKERTKV